MGATNYALRINAPTSTSSKAIATAAVTAQSLGGAARVWVKATEDVRIRFGASTVTCTSGDIWLNADTDYVFDVTPSVTHFSSMRVSTSGTIYWTKVA
jgi:hypothetical protein